MNLPPIGEFRSYLRRIKSRIVSTHCLLIRRAALTATFGIPHDILTISFQVPENCRLEVEDVTKDWVWRHKFDLIHMRYFFGSLTDQEWVDLYEKCFENLAPGGWIEQLEPDVGVRCDDGTLPQDSVLTTWGDNFVGCAERSGRSILTWQTMKRSIARAGFINVQEDLIRTPIGSWPKDQKLKEAGRINYTHWTAGLEGYAMYLLTKFGAPEVRKQVFKVPLCFPGISRQERDTC